MFQLSGYPCCHALAAIARMRYEVDDYVENWMKMDMYMTTYRHMIHPVPGMKFYTDTGRGPVGPPNMKILGGRPQKKRRKDGNDTNPNIATRRGLTHTCSNCLEQGHNRRNCKNPKHERSKYKVYKPRNSKCKPPKTKVFAPKIDDAPLPTEAPASKIDEATVDVNVNVNPLARDPNDEQAGADEQPAPENSTATENPNDQPFTNDEPPPNDVPQHVIRASIQVSPTELKRARALKRKMLAHAPQSAPKSNIYVVPPPISNTRKEAVAPMPKVDSSTQTAPNEAEAPVKKPRKKNLTETQVLARMKERRRGREPF